MLDKEYAVNILTALVDAADEMNGHGIKAKCLAANDAVFDTIRGLIPYLQNSEEVVRCRECKFWHREIYNGIEYFNFSSCDLNHHGDGNNFYCADGERREDATLH